LRIASGASRTAHRDDAWHMLRGAWCMAREHPRVLHCASAHLAKRVIALAHRTLASCTGIYNRSRASRISASSSASHAPRVARRRASCTANKYISRQRIAH
jgi:glutamine synthetase